MFFSSGGSPSSESLEEASSLFVSASETAESKHFISETMNRESAFKFSLKLGNRVPSTSSGETFGT